MTTATEFTRISIFQDQVWAGSGKLIDGIISDCGAQFCDDQDESENVYEMIEEAIEEGRDSLKVELSDRDEAVEITWSIVEPTVSTERIDNVTGWDIEIDGDVYPIVRDVTHAHPDAVHAVFMTRNESELQSLLDSHNNGDWFDGSKYLGRDAAGVGLVFGNNSDVE